MILIHRICIKRKGNYLIARLYFCIGLIKLCQLSEQQSLGNFPAALVGYTAVLMTVLSPCTQHSELLGFCTLSIVGYSKEHVSEMLPVSVLGCGVGMGQTYFVEAVRKS
jgi:hypothetical protein